VSGRVFGCLRPLVLGALGLRRATSLARGLDFWPAYLSGGSRYLMCPPSLVLVKGHSPCRIRKRGFRAIAKREELNQEGAAHAA
jgi:hypothetical protein